MKAVFKWVGIVFFALVVIGMFAGGGKKDGGNATAAVESEPAKAREVVKISAGELFKSYDDNEVATDERFKGKDVLVTGTVQAIDKDAFDNIVINFRTSNEFMPAHMKMKDTEKAAAIALKKGNKSAVQCQKMGRMMGSPFGNDCVFVSGS
ncbi:MAG TPA: hypothetical protein VJ576_16100 [Rhodocyclaceae bacterium]|nr:hypothetical protein [Rhodocyclaceae bacterium]